MEWDSLFWTVWKSQQSFCHLSIIKPVNQWNQSINKSINQSKKSHLKTIFSKLACKINQPAIKLIFVAKSNCMTGLPLSKQRTCHLINYWKKKSTKENNTQFIVKTNQQIFYYISKNSSIECCIKKYSSDNFLIQFKYRT